MGSNGNPGGRGRAEGMGAWETDDTWGRVGYLGPRRCRLLPVLLVAECMGTLGVAARPVR